MEQKTMKACVLTGPNQLEYRDVPVPEIEEPTDAILKMTLSTICTSDVHMMPVWAGDRIVGHEFCGEVVEVGSGCKKVEVGKKYAALFSQFCGECDMCKFGVYSLCPDGGAFGMPGNDCQGVMAEYVRVKWADRMLIPIPDGCTEEDAIMDCDMLTTGRFLVENAGIKEGDTVAIIGVGPVGMCACLAAKRIFKAKMVIAIDMIQERLDTCVEHGLVDYVINPSKESTEERVDELTNGIGVDISCDTTAVPSCYDTMINITHPSGVMSTIATTLTPVPINLQLLVGKNLTLVGGTDNFKGAQEMMDMIGRGELDTKWMLTHKKPLNDVIEGFEVFSKHLDGVIKWAVTPWDHSRD